MSHTPHELAEEFPDKLEVMSQLKQTDAHFARLADEYHEVNRTVHRAETNVEPMEELSEVDLRKKRAALEEKYAAAASLGKVIAVQQARGGIGSTTVAVNLADQLQVRKSRFRREPSNSVAIVLFEAWRQMGFDGS